MSRQPGDNRCFSSCHNSCHGPAIILASGPSAADFPVEAFASVPIITMNGAIAGLLGTAIRPLFYVCTDRGFPEQQPGLYQAALDRAQHLALWPDQIAELTGAQAARAFPLTRAPMTRLSHLLGHEQHLAERSRNLLSKRSRSIGFSKDMAYGFFDARTVAYVCVQLAYHLGFEQVFLVGLDLNGSSGRFYERQGNACSPCGLNDYFHSRILPSFQVARRAFDRTGKRLLNLSTGSRLPASVVQHADLHTLRRALRIGQ